MGSTWGMFWAVVAAIFLGSPWVYGKKLENACVRVRAGVFPGLCGAWRAERSSRAGAGGGRPTEPAPASRAADGGPSVPEDVARLVVERRLRPWRPGEDTVGYLFDPARRYFEEERMVSGRVPEAAQGLRSYRSGGFPMGVRDHVEGHVAARIRRLHAAAADLGVEAPWDFTLVINNEPCAGPVGCHRILRNILPQDSRLAVYVVRAADGRPELHDVYVGEGRALLP